MPFGPEFLDIAPDGTSAVISNLDQLARVDLLTAAVSSPIPLGSNEGTVLMPDGRTVFAIDGSPQSVYAVDLDTGTKGPSVALPDVPEEIATITPGQAPQADFAGAPGVSGRPTTFDGSSSTASCGAIAAYVWDFGDGSTPELTSTASVQHTYTAPGTYDVTLSVIDSAGTSTSTVFTGQAMLRNGGPQATTTQDITIGQGPIVATPRFTG